MITAERLRRFRGPDGPIALFRELGYEMAPIDIDVEQWRRAGIEVGWNGDHRLRLLCRMRRFDLFLLEGPPPDGQTVRKFLQSYHSYNVITKSSIAYRDANSFTISIYDISASGDLRRLDIDLRSPSAHALDRLNLLAAAADSLAMPRIFDRALDRESVTRRFFDRFRSAVHDVAAALAPQCPHESQDDVSGEALLILSRMLFLSFVQEKGWLNGERRFLADRLHAALGTGEEFFATVLVPLFFGCLNTPIAERDDRSRALGRIPYLNGGLFERTAFESRHPDLHLPNERMQQVVEDLFERFDFSVDESDAAGTHVDPEMLGKVFESLMAEDERAAAPLVGRGHIGQPGFLANDAAQHRFEIAVGVVGRRHGMGCPFARWQRGGGRGVHAAGGRREGRGRLADARPAAVMVLAAAVSADDAERRARGVGGHDGVHPVGLAGSAIVLERLAGADWTRSVHAALYLATDASARVKIPA